MADKRTVLDMRYFRREETVVRDRGIDGVGLKSRTNFAALEDFYDDMNINNV
jgi:hypothetical protein